MLLKQSGQYMDACKVEKYVLISTMSYINIFTVLFIFLLTGPPATNCLQCPHFRLYKYLHHTYARGPSFFHIFWKQSRVFLYLLASKPCILVFTTSIGVLPKTDTAPANPPNSPGKYNYILKQKT